MRSLQAISGNGCHPRCVLKLDLTKAHDTLEWGFLKKWLVDMRFPARFVHWIIECISIVSYLLIINDWITTPFAGGIRQGDLTYTYLFVLERKYLERETHQIIEDMNFNFHPKC